MSRFRLFSSASSAALPWPLLLWILVLADALCRGWLDHRPLMEILPLSLLHGILYALMLWTALRVNLERVTLIYLALPYVFFVPGWLNALTATLLSALLLFSLWRTLRDTSGIREPHVTLHHLGGFLLILAWVSLSGVGESGWQSPDWRMHNARLHDLTTLTWPIRYGPDQNFVYYLGYFLPAAALGKIASFDVATQGLFFWTLLGVTLTLRWLAQLSGWRFSAWLTVVFILFGPLDLLNVLLLNRMHPLPWPDLTDNLVVTTDYLHFRSGEELGFFAGNYLSNTFQLYWSPQQVIAGWLGMALLTHLFMAQRFSTVVFVYALLCLWAPLPMMALSPFLLLTIARALRSNWRSLFTIENSLGAGSLALVFLVFYTSGSAGHNLSFWLFERVDSGQELVVLLLLALCGWGLYALWGIPPKNTLWRTWFHCLVAALALLPLYLFGDFSDLLCRGSAPLMFLLLVFLLRTLDPGRRQRQGFRTLLLWGLLLLGTASAFQQMSIAWQHRGHREPVSRIPEAGHAFPNLGPDGTPFEHWFRKKLP